MRLVAQRSFRVSCALHLVRPSWTTGTWRPREFELAGPSAHCVRPLRITPFCIVCLWTVNSLVSALDHKGSAHAL